MCRSCIRERQVTKRMPKDLFNEGSPNSSEALRRRNRAIKNANRLCLFPIVSDAPNGFSVRVNSAMLDRLTSQCKPIEREILDLLISGYNQTEIAQKLNVSQSMVSRKITKFKKILAVSK